MTARIIDGRSLAEQVKAGLSSRIDELRARGTNVRLDAVLVGADGGAAIYARNQGRACHALGIEHVLHELPAAAGNDEIAACVATLNDDPDAHAIMVHLPLPGGVDTEAGKVCRAGCPDRKAGAATVSHLQNISWRV